MAGLILGVHPNAGQHKALTGIQIQSSAQGVAVPVCYGTQRDSDNLLWYSGFKATKTGSGGKGGAIGTATGKGSGSTYTYSANVIMGVCEGPIQGYGQVWASKTPSTLSALGFTSFLGTYPQVAWAFVTTNFPSQARPYTGIAYLAAAAYQLGSMAEIPQHTMEVYGFYSQRTVYTVTTVPGGSHQVTVGSRTWADGSTNSMWVADVGVPGFTVTGGVPGAGQYSVSAGVYTFNVADVGTAITIEWTGKGQDADAASVVNDILTSVNYGVGFPSTRVGEMNAYTENHVVGAGPFTATVTNAATFDDNLSVYDATGSGTLYTCVAASPGALEYTYAAGVYTFNAAASGKTLSFSYSALAAGTLPTFQAYAAAAGFFISPAYRTQQAGASVIEEIAKYLNSEVVFSAGALKLVPRGDMVLSGNGFTYTPPSSTVVDLTDDQFVANSVSGGASGVVNGDDPVLITRKRVSDQKNVIQVECLDRTNQYNTAVVEATDQAFVDKFGRRNAGSQAGHLFCDVTMARASAQLLLQREGVRNQFAFVLPATYAYLDPMDLVSLTDSRLGLASSDWVRLLSIEEQDDGTLHCVAEEYANGVANTSSYNFQQGVGYAANYNVDPGSINVPIITDIPVAIATNTGLETWGVFSGAGTYWGGCDVYISSDNVTYNFVGRKWGLSKQGFLTGALRGPSGVVVGMGSAIVQRKTVDDGAFSSRLQGTVAPRGAYDLWPLLRQRASLMPVGDGMVIPAGIDPDTSDTIGVDLSESFGSLISGTTADADNGNTLCVVDSELIAFSTATLTAPYNYNLTTYIRRGMYGTTIANHANGAPFGRLDEATMIIPYDKASIGSTIYVKACSFNIWGGGLQDISTAVAYSHTIGGPPTPAIVQNFQAIQVGLSVVLSWTDLNDLSVKGYDILYGPQGGTVGTALLLTQASRTTETTSAKVGAGDWSFYIRARNIADQTGPVSKVNTSLSAFSQTFLADGVWQKPSGITPQSLTIIEGWGGGGSGDASPHGGGGGGGAYVVSIILTALLDATEAVTIGLGGTPPGGVGGTTTVGAIFSAFGGGGTSSSGGGGGGGAQSAGADGGAGGGNGGKPVGGAGGTTGGDSSDGGGGGASGGSGHVGGDSLRGGGGGGSGNVAGNAGPFAGNSVFGGAGGAGGGTGTNGAPGTSQLGGNGGAVGSDGQVPGGGGGSGNSGGNGLVRITVIP